MIMLLKDYVYRPRKIKARCMALIPYQKQRFNQCRLVAGCLKELGMVLPLDFQKRWREDRGYCGRVYEEAHERYLKLARAVHPRKLGDSEEAARSLHVLWARVKKLFRGHMFPVFLPRGFVRRGPVPGMVRCVECGKGFKPKRRRRTDPVCGASKCRQRNYRKRHAPPRERVRCANPRCCVKFTPKHGAKYHSLKCWDSHRHRVKWQKDVEASRAMVMALYWKHRTTILAHRRGSYGRLPEERRQVYRKREALRGFKKRQLAQLHAFLIKLVLTMTRARVILKYGPDFDTG